MIQITDKDKTRLWKNVDIKGLDDCWLWTRSSQMGKYPQFRIKDNNYFAYRLIYQIINGDELQPYERIKHTCGNYLCCNPKHLALTDNSLELREQQRQARERTRV